MTINTLPIRRSLASRPGDFAMALFFVLHIPLTIFIDSQFVFPEWTKVHFPTALSVAPLNYAHNANDYLVLQMRPWFASFMWCELLVQLPFYVFLTHALITDSPHVRTAGLIYASHTCTTMIPILSDLIFTNNNIQSYDQRVASVAIYSVWFVVPFAMLVAMVWRKDGDGRDIKVKSA
ncbi:Transmembrane protein 97 [Physocladia obscura]|uniref:Efficient mitochondria targeting-associated protein 19 n=1 Tax=Physocladia obscura TaxID=109957 RepID=A0AAD5SWV2_9FUNG|nr:Transmembrane protein 97 [Physocladia obscura]